MDSYFERAYRDLNDAQRLAVDTIEGPVLVIAGPGTGKTQLLSVRIANIIRTTDSLPENILCLTFTDSAVDTMRRRLQSIIGSMSYGVTISTYHAFGSELLQRYPEYFPDSLAARPADSLMTDLIIRRIQAALPYANPFKNELFLSDLKTFISDAKRALLTAADLRQIAKHNDSFVRAANELLAGRQLELGRISKKSLPAFTALAEHRFAKHPVPNIATKQGSVVSLESLWQRSLMAALDAAQESGKTTALSQWKRQWLERDSQAQLVIAGSRLSKRLIAVADIFERYEAAMADAELYDYDDMILRAISGLEQNPNLRFSLQERYLYILLDEYQDTNNAQSKLVSLLTDSPVHEGRPNILAVGDDDQAIYAFQGADYSHMLGYYGSYRGVKLIALSENYRSNEGILRLSTPIAEQIETRIGNYFSNTDFKKNLVATIPASSQPSVIRRDFLASPTQNSWIVQEIRQLLGNGIALQQIAILAPKHKYLEELIPLFLAELLPIRYEKRDDVLQDPAIKELIIMSRLVLALKSQSAPIDELWALVLAMNFWNLNTERVWHISIAAHQEQASWTTTLLTINETKFIARFFIRLSQLEPITTLEQLLDYCIGMTTIDLKDDQSPEYRSPYYDYYFSHIIPEKPDKQAAHSSSTVYLQLVSNLQVLRSKLKDYNPLSSGTLHLSDFIDFVDQHEASGAKVLNLNPYQTTEDAVQLMTVYKAKGQEFEVVFLIGVQDEIWGNRARSSSSRIAVPENLKFIHYGGTTVDERLRLFYVALTRAKSKLYLLNFRAHYSGRVTTSLQFLNERLDDSQQLISPYLPVESQAVSIDTAEQPVADALEAYWSPSGISLKAESVQSLVGPLLDRFQLSPTQLSSFIDTRNNGPTAFFLQSIIRFRSTSSPSAGYGSAIHQTLEWIAKKYAKDQYLPETFELNQKFEALLRAQRLDEVQTELLVERGHQALSSYLEFGKSQLQEPGYYEYSFKNEGVFIGEAHLSGKIDRLLVNKTKREITIIDYKTGKSHRTWESDPKLHFYAQQLYFYKLLVEHSQTFKGYRVIGGFLEFVEPDEDGIHQRLLLNFDDAVESELKDLVVAVWNHIKDLSLPDTSTYDAGLKGIRQFEDDLRNKRI